MKTKSKVIKDVPSESKPAAKIAEELEAKAKEYLQIAEILKKGPTKKGGRSW